MNSILFITFLGVVLQSVMLIAFHCLPDALGMSIGELFSGKILWQISMDFGAILIIAFIFALWQNLSNRKNKTKFTIPVRIFALILGFYFALSVVDYEVLRFNHQRLSYSFLRTYFHFSNITDSTTFLILLGDIKGSILWLCLLSASVVGGILLAIFPPFRTHIAGAKSLLFLGIFGVILSAIPGVLFLSGTRGTIKIPIINATVDMRFTLGKHTLTAPVLHIGILEIVEHIRDNYKITKSNLENLDSFLPQEFINNRPDTDNFPAYTNSPTHEYRAKHPYNILLVLGESYKGRIFNQMLFGDTTLAPNLWSLANDTAIIGRGGGDMV
ncbi:hypothetical protein AGMMS49938_05910 [Fibrobacterales bacterium]|nr:hypothetical protein AGMMS49938_05910 [Fibrobacterales bacterium]